MKLGCVCKQGHKKLMHMRILTLTETLEIFAVHVKMIFIVHFKMIFTNSSITNSCTYVELFDVGSAGL